MELLEMAQQQICLNLVKFSLKMPDKYHKLLVLIAANTTQSRSTLTVKSMLLVIIRAASLEYPMLKRLSSFHLSMT